MDPAYLSALAALAGSAVGGLTSFLSTWLSQSAVLKAQLLLQDKARRQEIYRIFVEEASHMYIDALTHDTPTIDEFETNRPLRAGQPDAHHFVATSDRRRREDDLNHRRAL